MSGVSAAPAGAGFLPKSSSSSAAGVSAVPSAAAAVSVHSQQVSSDSPSSSRPNTPGPQTIHGASQRGDLQQIRALIRDGKAAATDPDEDGCTPLHWAAINNHPLACALLLDNGAHIDAVGGELEATALHWAARSGHLNAMHLLLSRGADPLLTDAQGFNTLQLTVHSSGVMPLLYVLQHPALDSSSIIDSPDTQGHTALMWAAYQGDGLSVELLLAHGANARAKDAAGLTPMHWAVVKGNRLCIRRIAEAGADLWEKEDGGKTPREMAMELKSIGPYKKGLADAGLEEDGRRKTKPLGEVRRSENCPSTCLCPDVCHPQRGNRLAIFFTPWLFLFLVFWTFSTLPFLTAAPLAAAEMFAMHHIVTRVLLGGGGSAFSGDKDAVNSAYMQEQSNRSPYFNGVVSGSVAWVAWEWGTKLAMATPGYPLANVLFALSLSLCAWNLFRASTLEPGYAPLPQNEVQRRSVVMSMTEQGKLNGMNFCIVCLARRPLRSKHCRFCKRCIARHDHHCPWVANCIGVNNHRQFFVFVASLIVGITLFIYLSVAYYTINVPTPSSPPSCILPSPICLSAAYDPFLLSVMLWSSLQLTWTIILLVAQSWQIMRQMTTLEVSNLGRYGFMGGKGGSSLSSQDGAMAQAAAARDAAASLAATQVDEGDGDIGVGTSHARPHGHGRQAGPKHAHGILGMLGGAGNWLLSIVGLDLYTKGKAGEGLKKASAAGNPFDRGLMSNCRDFWTAGRELGVRYEELYDIADIPLASSRDRWVEDMESAPGSTDRRWSMWATFQRGSGWRGGSAAYERLPARDAAGMA